MPTENKPAEPLKAERSTVTKLVITGAALDSITVFLEDFARRDCPIESDRTTRSPKARSPSIAGITAGTLTGAGWGRAPSPRLSPTAAGTTS